MRLILLLLSVLSFACSDAQMRMSALAGNRSIQTKYASETVWNETFAGAPTNLTITDGRCKWVGATGAASGFLGTTSYTRINGRAIRFSYAHESVYTGLHRAGWGTSLSASVSGMILHASGYTFQFVTGNHRIVKRAPNDVWSILRTNGYFACTQDKLLFVSATGNDTNLKPLLWIGGSQQCDFDLNEVGVFNLTKNGGGDWEDLIKVSSVTTPTATQTGTTANGNSYIEFTWTAATNEVLNIQFRRTDASNSWVIKCDEAADKIYLYERVAGVETERGATGGTATTFTNGVAYRIEIVADDRLLTSSVDATKKIEYESPFVDLTNQTATGVSISGFTTASNFIIWKRDITGLLPRAFEYNDYGLFVEGDSKHAGNINTTDVVSEMLWAISDRDQGRYFESPARYSITGSNTAGHASVIDAQLALRPETPRIINHALGANDVTAMPSEAAWKANTLYIIDARAAKWPGVPQFISKPWRRGYTTECNTLAGWIDDVIALRPGVAYLADDERVWFENGDDGVTYSLSNDGTHFNAAGAIKKSEQFNAAIALQGY